MPSESPLGASARQHYDTAAALLAQGQLGEAERHYRAVLQLHADHPASLHGLALILIHTGRLAEAAETYERIIALARNDATAHANLGQVLRSLGRNEEARAHLERSLVLRPGTAEIYTSLGNALAALNRPEDALACYAKAQALNPRLADTYNNMANVLSSLGRHEEAVAQFEKALALRPGFAAAANNLGNSLRALGRHEEAVAWFKRALALQPNFASAHNNLGTALAALDRHEEAVAQYREALAQQPDFAAAMNNLGNALHALVRPAEALEVFEKLAALEPENAWARFGAGNALQILGRLDETRQAYERAVSLAPEVASFHRALAEAKKFRDGDPQLPVMEELAGRIASLSENDQIELHFALAKAYGDLKRPAPAFEHLRAGNALKRQTIAYDEAAQLGALRDIEAAFTPELIAARRGEGYPSQLPVFILGMPRSGTTLVEQILASHPAVFGAGELLDMFDLVAAGEAGAQFPSGIAAFPPAQLRRFGEHYVARLRARAPQAERITDKLPANFSLVGLIHLTLPKARIIHVRRDPADTCFSCYANLFSQGLEFTYELGELGRHYRAYEALMELWRRVLPAGAMLDVQYEELVGDFEPQARRIVAYCGLEWNARCLSFHETRRAIRTASVEQVRRPLFNSSIGRWRPYEEWLGPLLDALKKE